MKTIVKFIGKHLIRFLVRSKRTYWDQKSLAEYIGALRHLLRHIFKEESRDLKRKVKFILRPVKRLLRILRDLLFN